MLEIHLTNPKRESERGAWVVPAGLAVSVAMFNLVLNPTHRPLSDLSAWLGLMGLGVLFVQPLLLAMWTALGSGAIVYRLPMSLAILIIWIFAQTFVGLNLFVGEGVDSELNLEMAAAFLVVFAVAAAGLGLLRRYSQIHIARREQDMSAPQRRRNQFGMRYLLGWMTVCPLFIVVGQTFMSNSLQFNQPWLELAKEVAVGIAFLLLLTMPPAILPILALTRPAPWRIALLVIVLWPLMLWLAILMIAKRAPAAPPELIWMVFVMQIGATATALVCALVLRLAGFRLVSTFEPDSTSTAV